MDGMPQIVAEVERRLKTGGTVGFEELMELALFAEGVGFYRRSVPARGAEGHFTTCARLSPALGRALLPDRIARTADFVARINAVDL